VYAYIRESEGQKMLILLNFSATNAQSNIGLITTNSKVLLSNYKNSPINNKIKSHVALRPYEAIIYKLLNRVITKSTTANRVDGLTACKR